MNKVERESQNLIFDFAMEPRAKMHKWWTEEKKSLIIFCWKPCESAKVKIDHSHLKEEKFTFQFSLEDRHRHVSNFNLLFDILILSYVQWRKISKSFMLITLYHSFQSCLDSYCQWVNCFLLFHYFPFQCYNQHCSVDSETIANDVIEMVMMKSNGLDYCYYSLSLSLWVPL